MSTASKSVFDNICGILGLQILLLSLPLSTRCYRRLIRPLPSSLRLVGLIVGPTSGVQCALNIAECARALGPASSDKQVHVHVRVLRAPLVVSACNLQICREWMSYAEYVHKYLTYLLSMYIHTYDVTMMDRMDFCFFKQSVLSKNRQSLCVLKLIYNISSERDVATSTHAPCRSNSSKTSRRDATARVLDLRG